MKRKCAKCGEPAMEFVSREMQIYNSVCHYQCTNCGHKVDLVPLGSLGAQITVSVVFAAIIWMIFFSESYSRDAVSLLIFIAVISILPLMAVFQLLKHRAYPKCANATDALVLDDVETRNITKKPINWIEKGGFIIGLLAPLLLIAAVLGLATIIGFINFTFFQQH